MTIGDRLVRKRNRSTRTSALVLGTAAILSLFMLVGCSTARPSPAEAKRSAVELLKKTEARVAVDWPRTPEPSAERCDRGVRFGYFVAVRAQTDSRAVARELQELWRSEGLEVSPSETDFGQETGVLFSATADANGGPGAAYQLSDAALVIRVTSPCADGAVEDYEE